MLPPVPTGKLVIPGDPLDAYLAALEHAETARARCRSRLTGRTTVCGHALATTDSPRTVRKHTHTIERFSALRCDDTDVQRSRT